MTDEKTQHLSGFIEYLMRLSTQQDRGALAVLRRGLAYPPGEDVNMYPYIARFVREEDRNREREKVYYLIAALYASHPMNAMSGNLGNHMARTILEDKNSQEATERRFTALLNADFDDLPRLLRQTISYLKAKETPVCWQTLFDDLTHWSYPQRRTQRKWANAFWGYQPTIENDSTDPSIENLEEN